MGDSDSGIGVGTGTGSKFYQFEAGIGIGINFFYHSGIGVGIGIRIMDRNRNQSRNRVLWNQSMTPESLLIMTTISAILDLRLLDTYASKIAKNCVLACDSANKPSFQNPSKIS